MAVVIKNMDLPSSCVLCPFQTADMVGEYCVASDYRETDSTGKPEWCPLEENN